MVEFDQSVSRSEIPNVTGILPQDAAVDDEDNDPEVQQISDPTVTIVRRGSASTPPSRSTPPSEGPVSALGKKFVAPTNFYGKPVEQVAVGQPL